MRCKNCPYLQYDMADDMYLCLFGFEDENSKGECGCKYNMKQLKRFDEERLDDIAKEGEAFYNFFKGDLDDTKG